MPLHQGSKILGFFRDTYVVTGLHRIITRQYMVSGIYVCCFELQFVIVSAQPSIEK